MTTTPRAPRTTASASSRRRSVFARHPQARAATCSGLLVLAFLAGTLPAAAQDPDLPGAVANMKLIESGALVIPMDNTNQNALTGFAFNIRAYGLVNKILQNEIPVLWAISTTKVKDGTDFTVNAERVLPGTLVPATSKSFAGGPFIVTKDHAAAALALANAFQTSFASPGAMVAVYRTTADVTVDVRYDLRFKPWVGVGNVNTAIHSDILVRAGFPGSLTCGAYNKTTCNWTMVDPLQVNNVACLTSHTDPHRDSGVIANLRTQISSYLQSGGNFIAQCAAVRFFEGETGTTGAGAYLTTKGITDANNNTAHIYDFTPPTDGVANTPFLQIVGDVDPGQGGSWPDGILPSGGAFKNNGYYVVKDTTPANSFQAIAGKVKTGIGGNVFYLGGHDYGDSSKTLPEINGLRMFLNTIFVPPTRPPSCGFNFLTPGKITIIKDSDPDDPWHDFTFQLTGPSKQLATLQDPGSNQCPGHPLCADPDNTPAWDHPNRQHFTSMEPTVSTATRYVWTETGLEVGELANDPATLADYDTSWECKNVPLPETNPTCDPNSSAFNYDLCPTLAASCALDGGWTDGFISGVGTSTLAFDLCQNGHVICKFLNHTDNICLETATALGDLRVLGDVGTDQVTFTTAAVSAGEASDSIFLASFTPVADQSHWPGTVDHFIQPLPVIENDDHELVPDKSRVCDDDDETSCLAWDAGVEILDQAPDSAEVAIDRQIGTASNERRVTYTKAASGMTVPRSTRAFDYSDSDAIADERDLWTGMGIAFVSGDTDSENIARLEARKVIREALRERSVTITNPETSETETITYVLGDFFHGSPTVVGGPSNFFNLANDLEGNGQACSVTGVNANKGYRCFFEKERRRRKVLLAPSNDGEIHAFDAGFFHGSVVNHQLVGEFDRGTGHELFAHLPRPMLAHTRAMVTEDHDFGVDGALVVDDVFMDPAHNGTPTAGDRQWRSVVIGGYREGARGLYAMDITQPDPLTPHNVNNFAGQADVEYTPTASPTDVPACSALNGSPPSGCSQPYPSMLWEFEDLCGTSSCDLDGNGHPDLAFSWSKPNTGRVLVIPAGETDPVAKFVAIFGGGLDPDNLGDSGNYLYMVDIETGKAIYKARLNGAVPSQPAAVDTDQNGFIDTIYVGTAFGENPSTHEETGYLYKVDVAAAGQIVAATGRVNETAQWTPFRVFDTDGRAIFFPPTVIFDANSGHYAVAFGTGDRADLWSGDEEGQEGRFYLILDTGFAANVAPFTTGQLHESDFEVIPADADPSTANFLVAPVGPNRAGWVLALGANERVVSDSLAISGLLAFTTFNPEHPEACEFGGNGKIYTLLATNANPLGGTGAERARSILGFAGQPIVTQSGFSKPGGQGQGDTDDPFEAQEVQEIRSSLMDLFPADCRFGNFSLNISSSLSSREVVPLAQIPVCIARKNWTEH